MSVEKRNKKRQQAQQTSGKQSRKLGKFNPDYFVLPHPFWLVTIPVAILLLVVATFKPESIPDFLGPLGTFSHYMGTEKNNICVYLCVFCVAAHSAEAAFAGKLCHDRGMTTSATIKWVISTFMFGFPSLMLRLLPYKPERKIF